MPPKIQVAIYDLDNTLTRSDTFFSFVRYFLKKHPLKIVHFWSLPIAFALSRLKLCDRVLVKKVVMRQISRISKPEQERLKTNFVKEFVEPLFLERGLKSIAEHKKAGFKIILISASPSFYVTEVAKTLGVDAFLCTNTIERDGRFLVQNHCYGKEKINRLDLYLKENNLVLDYETSFFYSDHHSDYPLMAQVGNPIVVNGTKKFLAIASKNNWKTFNWKLS